MLLYRSSQWLLFVIRNLQNSPSNWKSTLNHAFDDQFECQKVLTFFKKLISDCHKKCGLFSLSSEPYQMLCSVLDYRLFCTCHVKNMKLWSYHPPMSKFLNNWIRVHKYFVYKVLTQLLTTKIIIHLFDSSCIHGYQWYRHRYCPCRMPTPPYIR